MRLFVAFLSLILLYTCISAVNASGNGVYNKIYALKSKYPDGYHWNHYAETYNDVGLSSKRDERFAESVTTHPCATHTSNAVPGQYECNYFDGGIQCWGFARRIFYEVFGIRASACPQRTDYQNVQIGDYVRFSAADNKSNGHSFIVLAKNGNNVTALECNAGGRCLISWSNNTYNLTGTITSSSGKLYYFDYFIRATNYDEVNAATPHTHSFSSAWTYDATNHWHKCTGCSEISGKTAHTFNAGVVTSEPTYYDSGIKTYTCTVCDYSYTEGIPKLIPSGYCGGDIAANLVETDKNYDIYDNLTWTLNLDTGVLTISGTGKMVSHSTADLPWDPHRDSIKKVVIGNGVTTIGSDAFLFCRNLTSVIIPDSMIAIENMAFSHCGGLVSVIVPEGVTSIGYGAFEYCTDLTSVTIPESTVSVSSWAFANCSNLTEIYYPGTPAQLDRITVGGFHDIPDDVTIYYTPRRVNNIVATGFCGDEIEDNYFNISYALDSDGVLSIIGTGEMDSSSYLDPPWHSEREQIEKAVIHHGVSNVGLYTFKDCSNLTSVSISDSVKTIEYGAFQNCSKLTDVVIPDSVTEIKSWAFNNCSSLTNLHIGKNVITIDTCAFWGCASLANILIPKNVASIGDYAFEDCNDLTDIYYTGPQTQWEAVAAGQDAIPDGVTIHYNYVPTVECDLNGDSVTNTDDLTILTRYVTGIRTMDAHTVDINGDKAVNAADLVALARMILGSNT